MIHVPWKERYSIHYKGIDQQHKELLSILNQLVVLIKQRTEPEQVRDVFGRLCQYAIQHFSTEERYLRASGYEGLSYQHSEHAWFINRVLELDRSYDPSDPTLLETTLIFLKHWFVQHIIESDQDYAAWVRSFYKRAKIRGIIFDFGNVIAHYDNDLILDRLAAMCGVESGELGRRFQAEPSLSSDFESGAISPEQFLGEVSRLCGRTITESEFIPVFTDIFTPIQSTCDLIRRLKQRYQLGLISNTNPWHFLHGIQTSEVFHLFDAVTTSFQVRTLKPDPRIYQDSLDKLDLVAEECVFIDDVAAFAHAASHCLLHGIHYRGPQELVDDLRKLDISF
jgi:glucose-1-phosphatase